MRLDGQPAEAERLRNEWIFLVNGPVTDGSDQFRRVWTYILKGFFCDEDVYRVDPATMLVSQVVSAILR
jgi:hypothetical protein